MTENKIKEDVIKKVWDADNKLNYRFQLTKDEKWMMLCENEKLKKYIEKHKCEPDLCSTFKRIRRDLNYFINYNIPFCSEKYNEEELIEYKKQLKNYLSELTSRADYLNPEKKKTHFHKGRQ